MVALNFVERRVARVRSLFLRLGMRSQRLLLADGTTTMHCWVPPSSSSSMRPPLLLIPSFGWDGMVSWACQLEAFLEAGFAVYVPDLVFFGQSSTGSSKRSEAFQAECMVDMLRKLKVESRVHVLGTSYGALVALHLASEFPQLVQKVTDLRASATSSSLLYMVNSNAIAVAHPIDTYLAWDWKVVISSSGVCMDVADRIALQEKLKVDDMMRILLPNTTEGVEETLKLILSNPPPLPESAHKELLEMVHLKNRDAKVEVYCESTLWTDKAHFRPTLTQEVLLVWGDNDRLFDTDQAWKLKKHLGGNATLVIIKNAGHLPESETPRAFNDAVIAFLKDNAVIAFWKDESLPLSRL